MDLRWFWGVQPVFVGHGVRGDRNFQGDWEDELIGVFYADDSLTRITRVVDIFPTHAWLDLDVGFERPYYPIDSIRVIGMGATHGEFGVRRAYARTAGDSIRSR
jgi:hypothetical protein